MELYPYQQEAVRFLAYDGGIYADPPGTGKTPTTLSWLRVRQHVDEVALIVVPKVMLGHWEREASLWYPELQVVRMTGTPAKRASARREAGRLSGTPVPTALLTNYEAVRSDHAELHPDILICDEAHRLKNRAAQVTKAMQKVAKTASSTALLTGTPIMNSAHELWSLLRLLDPEEYRSFWRWAERYFVIEQTTFNFRSPRPVTLIHGLKPEAAADLIAEVRPYMIHRPLRDLVDLPPLTESMVPVELTAAERKAYKAMSDHAWADINGTIVQAQNDVAKFTRLRQLASEWGALGDTGDELGSKGKATVELVQDLLDQGEQVVVLTAYKNTASRVAAELAAGLYTGDIRQDHREMLLAEFAEGTLRCMVGTLATMGEGVDGLQVARHLVLLDRDWTPARNDQAVGRLLRSGQTRPVTVHHIYAEGTIDADVAEACIRKQSISDMVLGAS